MTSRTHTPEDVQKIMEPWSPVSIGVDITEKGAHVIGIYALDKDTSQIFYAKHHPVPHRTWVGLTEEDLKLLSAEWRIVYGAWMDDFARDIEAKLKEKNT